MSSSTHGLTLVFIMVTPMTTTDRERLADGLQAVLRRDERISVAWDAEAASVEVGGEDDEHLDTVLDSLRREFGVTAAVSRPRVDVRRALFELPTGRTWTDVEPWMDVEIRTPPFYIPRLREAFPRLQLSTRAEGDDQTAVTLACRAPLVELFGVRLAVREMTHGEAHTSVRFADYAPRRDDVEPGALVRTTR